jgi:HlyD family secretion protein
MNKLSHFSVFMLSLSLLAACDQQDSQQMVGTLERDRIEIKVESNEPIISRSVIDGQMVASGDLILQQDPTRAQAKLDQQLALRDQSMARLAELRRGPRPEAISETRARLEALEAQTAKAKADFDRTSDIFEKGLSDQAALDLMTTRWKFGIAEEKAMRESLQAQLVGTTIEELDQAEAALAAANAQVEQAQLDLDRTQLFAPVDGQIDKQLYQLGERPPAGSTVAVLLDSSRVYARIYVPENLRIHIRPGDSLSVLVDGIDAELSGTVRWVSTDASFTPYFALTEHDRSRLSYLAEVDVPAASELPSGVPLVVIPPRGSVTE